MRNTDTDTTYYIAYMEDISAHILKGEMRLLCKPESEASYGSQASRSCCFNFFDPAPSLHTSLCYQQLLLSHLRLLEQETAGGSTLMGFTTFYFSLSLDLVYHTFLAVPHRTFRTSHLCYF
jgi:hypothetical protein